MKRFSVALSRRSAAFHLGPSFCLLPVLCNHSRSMHVTVVSRHISTTNTSATTLDGNAVGGGGFGGDVHDTEETHPDFQPRFINSDIAEDEVAMVKKDIDDTIRTEEVVAFIKGVPEAPMCAFSRRMIDMLEALGLEYTSFDVLAHPVVRTHVKDVSEWPTIPQLFLKGEFVGGLDVVQKMLESGDMQKLLDQKSISYRNPIQS